MHAACIAVVVLNWAIYYPGVGPGDTIFGIYKPALERSYGDWFPPFIAVMVTPLLACGLKLGTITLLQSLLGSLGVYQFVYALTRLAFRSRIPATSARTLACVAVLGLFLPVSPFKFHVMLLGNDTWEVLLLVWVGAVWLRLIDRVPELTPAQVRWRVAIATLVEGAALLSRHNAIVMLPAFALLTWLSLRPQGWKMASAFVLALVVLKPAANAAIYRLAHVTPSHPEDQVMALDLIGLCVEDASLRARFPYTSAQLVEDRYRTGYEYGNVLPFSPWVPAPIVKNPERMFRGAHAEVAREWRTALKICPKTLALVKLKAFVGHLFHPSPMWFNDAIVENDLGLRQNRKWERVRLFLRDLHWRVAADPVPRWFLARHLPWLSANLCLVLALVGSYRVSRDRRLSALAALLAAPLLYYLSHVLAVAEYSYRYMFPATLFVQLFAVTLAIGWATVKMKEAVRGFEGAPPSSEANTGTR
jgi:hypothetical protein